MVMSNMNTKRNKPDGTKSAKKTNQQRQTLHREEFGAEFELDSA